MARFPVSYPKLNLDIVNPFKSGVEVGAAIFIVFMCFLKFAIFLSFLSFTLENDVFNNLIQGFRCNNHVFKLPKGKYIR